MIKTIDTTNITDEMVEVAAASAQLRAMAGVTENTALIRGSILAALIAAPEVEPWAGEPVVIAHKDADPSLHAGSWATTTPAFEPVQSVPMPQNADQAQLMANAGIAWLKANAPERLVNGGGE